MIGSRKALLGHLAAHPVGGPVARKRTAFAMRLDAPEGGKVEIYGGVEGLRFGHEPISALWFHGGGYVLGSPETHVAPIRHFVETSTLTVFAPRYRLAPEHVWPAPLDDALAALDALPGRLVLIGDSAGGHLALNVALARPSRVCALILFSPNTDRTGRSDTRIANTPTDPMNSDTGDHELWRMVMPETAPGDPHASPLLADLSGLPPTYLCASEEEVLLGDTRLLDEALGKAGVERETVIVSSHEAGLHMFQNWPEALPAARRVLENAAAFAAARC